MDIDQHVNQIVQNIVADITTKVQVQAMAAIEQKIAEVVANIDTSSMVGEQLSKKIEERLGRLPIDSRTIEAELTTRVGKLATNLANEVQTRSIALVHDTVQKQVGRVNFVELFQNTLITALKNKELEFPKQSIPLSAVVTTGLEITGDAVSGGIIKNFSSTGIDDKSTACQLTILDDITVVENNLLTQDLTVKGTTTIEGDLIVTGSVPESSAMYVSLVKSVADTVKLNLNADLFNGYSDTVFAKIKEAGLDLNKITLNGTEIVNGGNLSNNITFSNLQRVGTLTELRVGGEALLSQTLYTTNKRIGINTLEPAQALSIWDQEVEIGFGKRAENTAVIEVPRNQKLIIGVNNKNNLVLLPDGNVIVDRLSIGAINLSSSSTPPNNNAPQGSIVFNSNPTIGGPLGWVSLGGARWANFGFID